MAWNPSPKVKFARSFGDQFDKDIVVVLAVNTRTNTLEAVTYGRTKALCDEARVLGDIASDAIYKTMEEVNGRK